MTEAQRLRTLSDAAVETQTLPAAAGEKRTRFARVRERTTRNCVDPWNAAFGRLRPSCAACPARDVVDVTVLEEKVCALQSVTMRG